MKQDNTTSYKTSYTSDASLINRINLLNTIGTALSVEKDINRLLETILIGAKQLTNADAGTLYILKDNLLEFMIVHTSSIDIHMGGTSGNPILYEPISLFDENGDANLSMVVTRAALNKKVINIPDAYADTEYNFSGTRKFDQRTGYRSQSFLTVPMLDHEGQTIGVLQLINAMDPDTKKVFPFSAIDESLANSLASQAAIAMNRKQLIDGLEELLQSLVKLIATAIDEKNTHTGDHCRRVPLINMALAKAVNDDEGPVLGDIFFDEEQLKEIEIAAWLHDCGKIVTPEHVINKGTRLETIFDRVHLVNTRLEMLRYMQDETSKGLGRQTADNSALDIDEIQEFIHACNNGSIQMNDSTRQRLHELSKINVPCGVGGEDVPMINEDELLNLSISRGTLTQEERDIINNHANVSMQMLKTLPLPKNLQRVAEIAAGHHERMDGEGYPRGLQAEKLPVQARILAIADVFEALTASDRVYRKPNTVSEALKIMAYMCKERHFDPDLLELFIARNVYNDYAKEHLLPEQFDHVEIETLLGIFKDARSCPS